MDAPAFAALLAAAHRYIFVLCAVTGSVVWTLVIVGGSAWAIVRLATLFEERVE